MTDGALNNPPGKREHILQRQLNDALKSRGFLTFGITVPPQAGFPDVLAFRNGRPLLVEVKHGGAVASDVQIRMHRLLKGHGVSVKIVHDSASVIRLLDALDNDHW